MKWMTIFVILFVIPNDAKAFKWDKCKKVGPKSTIRQSWQAKMFDELISSTTSSSQFTTSTGECAMIGQIDHDKKVYIAHNVEFLQIDIARGAGEYLHNFASISKCDEGKLKPLLKKNYQRIFSSDELNPELIYQNIDEVIRENNQTGELCSAGVS